jgi:protein phosphatase 1 regulatory subunit 11
MSKSSGLSSATSTLVKEKSKSKTSNADNVIRLKPERRVSWDPNVVDNENMNKKKSNVCCIFHAKNPKNDQNSPCPKSKDDDGDHNEN